MTVGHVSPGGHIVRPAERQLSDAPFEKLRVGQQLNMSVLRQIDEHNYLVSLAGGQHVVDSSVALQTGGQLHAVVVAVGERLELRYVDSGQPASSDSEKQDDDVDSSLLAKLESEYRITLRPEDHRLLEQAAARASDPAALVLSGLFLAKLGLGVEPVNLQALLEAQQPGKPSEASASSSAQANTMIAAAAGDEAATTDLAQMLAAALEDAGAEGPRANGAADSAQPGSNSLKNVAEHLLNFQDEGGTAYRYGTLPVLVSGQLIELDLVSFQPKRPQAATPQVRRLVMTLNTESFGPLQVEARALSDRLVITFTGRTAESAAELAPHADEVRSLATRLGWNVDAVGYEYNDRTGRAARQVIDHVLSSGTVDLVL